MKGPKVALVVICLVLAAVIVYFTWGDSEDIPTGSVESSTNWKCAACGHQFKLTDNEFYQQLQNSPNGNSPLICPKCAKRDAWMVALCPKCHEWYYGVGKPGETGMCPKCSPAPKEETRDDNSGPVERRPRIDSI